MEEIAALLKSCKSYIKLQTTETNEITAFASLRRAVPLPVLHGGWETKKCQNPLVTPQPQPRCPLYPGQSTRPGGPKAVQMARALSLLHVPQEQGREAAGVRLLQVHTGLTPARGCQAAPRETQVSL
jgi:hypothetical protein